MLELKKGIDILAEVGGIKSIGEAKKLFQDKLDQTHLARLGKIKNEEALLKIANAIALCQPDRVFITTGSAEDMKQVRKMSIDKGEESPLAMKDHTIHYDLPEEQGRIVDRTFYIVNPDEKVSVLAKKMLRDDALAYVREHMTGIMKGKTMMVGFFCRGPAGAKMALPALEISSSTYVMHSGDILYRHVYDRFDEQVERAGLFLTNVHAEGLNRPEDLPNARVFMDRSWLTTFAMFCTYAGNTLLLKKGNHRFAVDLATYYGKGEQLSEHMFITGMKEDSGRTTWFAGAAPSGCGKTTTAMAGTDFIGDDLAQMWIADDGTMRAINPEQGIFGIVADVNREGDPHLMKCLREEGTEIIWSNVLIDEKKVPHWTGNNEKHPDKGFNFQGDWFKGKKDANGNEIPISHPNARCTLRCKAIDNYDPATGESPEGATVKVITYSGRDSDTMPPVWVGKTPEHGVVIGASIVSAATATEVGASGVKRQPWANAPFIPGALSDYMSSQFEFFGSPKFTDAGRPILAGLNYFLTDASRGGTSPQLLGEKRDVPVWLTWLAKRAHGEVDAIDTPVGYLPLYDDLRELFSSIIDKDYPRDLYDKQFSIYVDKIQDRIELQREALGKEENLPGKLFEVYDEWSRGLAALKEKYGPVVTPDQLIEASELIATAS
ncbi:MAG: phosphoenolpyruvate carboxykinase (GTP) [Phycisphaerales bacterium]|nr:MAG: phosphoenolpyruvate carboxykinase (GTP) [Phycisphaerales bacterium]